MPAVAWCTPTYARSALMQYTTDQVGDDELEPAILKAQGWVRAAVAPAIANQADVLATAGTLKDDAGVKVCAAMFACYWVLRTRFMNTGANKNPWLTELRDDAEKMLKLIQSNPGKALGGAVMSQDGVGKIGLLSSKEGRHIAPSIATETANSIDRRNIEEDYLARESDQA